MGRMFTWPAGQDDIQVHSVSQDDSGATEGTVKGAAAPSDPTEERLLLATVAWKYIEGTGADDLTPAGHP